MLLWLRHQKLWLCANQTLIIDVMAKFFIAYFLLFFINADFKIASSAVFGKHRHFKLLSQCSNLFLVVVSINTLNYYGIEFILHFGLE